MKSSGERRPAFIDRLLGSVARGAFSAVLVFATLGSIACTAIAQRG
jgi:hypothetical protein